MTPALVRFVEALRAGGIAVSPSELLDAARALDVVGVSDRARVRAALRATLTKDHASAPAFERTFDEFFAPPRAPGEGKGKERTGKSTSPSRPSRRPEERRATRPPPKRQEPTQDRSTKSTAPSSEKPADPRRRRKDGPRILRNAATAPPSARGAATSPSRRDLSAPAATQDERELARVVPRMIDEIRLRSGRRLRRGRRGRLWSSRILRENLAHDGVPFVLPMRSRKPRRPRVVLLVDVSFSVARAAGYFLWMASEFLRIGRDARVVAFVDRPVDATDAVRRWLSRKSGAGAGASTPTSARGGPRAARLPGSGIAPAGRPFDGLLRSLQGINLDAPSDYGRALHALLHSSLRPAGRDTVLVVLGDGRTNRFDPLAWTLEEIGRRCRAVLWLVPEPRSRWGTADSALDEYLPWVDVAVECHDLEGLARGLAELLRTL